MKSILTYMQAKRFGSSSLRPAVLLETSTDSEPNLC